MLSVWPLVATGLVSCAAALWRGPVAERGRRVVTCGPGRSGLRGRWVCAVRQAVWSIRALGGSSGGTGAACQARGSGGYFSRES